MSTRFGHRSSTLIHLLRTRATETPDRRAYTFLGDLGTEEFHLTYSELDQKARAIGALLRQMSAKGARAVMLYPPGADFIVGLFGALYGGVPTQNSVAAS